MKVVTTPGFLQGHLVRRARKSYWCDGWSHPCSHARIEAGQEYVEGDCDIDRAGGFGHKRYCAACCPQEIAEAKQEPVTQ